MMRIELAARPPFSLAPVVLSHGWIRLLPFNEEQDHGLSYIDQLSSGKVLELKVDEIPGGVAVTTHDDLTPAERGEIAGKVGWMLGLEQDFSAFYDLAAQEPKLAHVVAKASGRLLRSPSLFEDVIKTILTTNTLWAATRRMCANLINQFGAPLPDDPLRRAFPSPSRLAATDEATLRAETRLGYRAPYVLELAQQVDSSKLALEALKESDLPTPELRKRLLSLKGVGPYAAANLLMLLGRYDDIPIDSWAFKMVSYEWYNGQPVGPAEVKAHFDRFGEWKGLAYWMWDWNYTG
jgi:3-methyladenine DNA glycosylase/8-oxoguanine DNA glycosylase